LTFFNSKECGAREKRASASSKPILAIFSC
jgi:hypothetical protein